MTHAADKHASKAGDAPCNAIADFPIPPFRPHPLLRNGHAQTLAGVYVPGRMPPYAANRHEVILDDGDRVVVHDDCPPSWKAGDRVVLLVHGLAGCHGSPYMRRIAGKLHDRGVRSFRMDLRGCGAGFGLARRPYHSGLSTDVRAVLGRMAELCPASPITVAGFSLGANLVLKMLGEIGDQPLAGLVSAVAVNPPADLLACITRLSRRRNRLYDRHFLRSLMQDVARRTQFFGPETAHAWKRRPRRLYDFDDLFTAPIAGYRDAEDYYRSCSSIRTLAKITLPTLIITSRDDPLVPAEPLELGERPTCVRLHITTHGGHLGFIGRGGVDADRRWIDWRVVEWVAYQDRLAGRSTSAD